MSLALSGCARNSGFIQRNAWVNPTTWFNKGNLDQKDGSSQTSPDISNIKGPLTPPEPAPRTPVEAAVIPGTVLSTAAPAVKIKVALLLPLKGKNAALGQAMQNAAEQAVFDAANSNFELMPRDTGDNEISATSAARDAIASGAQLLIGPVFSTSIPAVKAIAEQSHISMLPLSTDTSFAAPGVYVMGFAPGPQVQRIVNYAASRGLKHFAALIPATPYGKLVGDNFKQAVAHVGGTLVAFETYDPTRHDSDAHIRALALRRDQTDALFLPEGGGDLALIAGQLSSQGFDNNRVRLLGTGLWDVDGLVKQSSFLASGWYAASDPSARQSFAKAYLETHKVEPPRLTTLAYDATALAAVLAKRGAKFDAASLTNPNGFSGLDGIFRLMPDGLVERGLAVNEMTMSGAKVIDPAPSTFAGN